MQMSVSSIFIEWKGTGAATGSCLIAPARLLSPLSYKQTAIFFYAFTAAADGENDICLNLISCHRACSAIVSEMRSDWQLSSPPINSLVLLCLSKMENVIRVHRFFSPSKHIYIYIFANLSFRFKSHFNRPLERHSHVWLMGLIKSAICVVADSSSCSFLQIHRVTLNISPFIYKAKTVWEMVIDNSYLL